jgi:hypothetical protein
LIDTMKSIIQERRLQSPSGLKVTPQAALTGNPNALAWRPETDTRPLEGWSSLNAAHLGGFDALGAGMSASEGAEPLSAGAGAAGAPNLDTLETNTFFKPPSPALFGPVWMTADEHNQAVAAELRNLALYYMVHGKRRRDFVKKARALLSCGTFGHVNRCNTCGAVDASTAIIECACGLRACPRCSRRRADILRKRLDDKWCMGEHPRDMSLYLLTFTLRYDPASPDDLSLDGLKRRKQIVRDAVGFVWRRYLKPRGRALALSLEVSPRGAVHIHALYHGRRPDAGTLRETYMFRAGASPMVNCTYVRKPAKAIRELAKYMLKAASPKNPRILRGGRGEFIDPVLAARAEVAFSGDRLFESMGAWRGADEEKDLPEQAPRTCAHCGASTWKRESVRVLVLLAELPPDWIPRFGRAGPQSKENIRPHLRRSP